MKSIVLFNILLHLFLINSYAQVSKDIPAFGKIDIAELKMNDCAFAPGATAVQLLKYEEVTLSVYPNGTNRVETLTRCRIKILKKSGFQYANIGIEYERSDSKISDVEGIVYNLDEGGQVKISAIDKSDIYKAGSSKKSGQIRFTFPDLKEGSVFEYRFTRKEKGSYLIPSWYFQNSIPTLLSVYKLTRPSFSMLQKRIVGDRPVEEESWIEDVKGSEEKLVTNYFSMRNVPAFVPEKFMSSSKDYRYAIHFLSDPHENAYQSFIRKSEDKWRGANSWLLYHHYFGGQFNSDIPGTKKFIDSVDKLQEVPAKISAVYKYVKRKIKWNNYYFLLSREMTDVWNEGVGSSAEINLAILNLLRKCHVTCFPVLYSTRLHGTVDYNFADLGQFNTVNIAVVNGKKFDLLDGTNPYLEYDTPPLNVVNRTGMIIDEVNNTKIEIDFDRKLLWDSVYVYASIGSNGVLKGKIVKKYFDLSKSLKRQNSSNEEDDETDNKAESVNTGEIKIDSTYQLDAESDLLPLTEISTFHYELPSTGDFYFADPFIFSDLSKNPFTDTARRTDIDFIASNSSVITIQIALPPDIKLEELAKEKEITGADNSLAFRIKSEIKNDTIYINSSFEINKPFFNKSEYPALRKDFEKIYSLLNSQVLLRRKKSS